MSKPITVEAHSSYVISLHFTADDRTLISAGMDNVVKLCKLDPWEQMREPQVGTPAISSMAFSSDGRRLAVGAADRKIRIRELA